MKTIRGPSRLGSDILVVLDNWPGELYMLRAIVANLPDLPERSFTLLHCCPTSYWEHGGGSNPEILDEIATRWEAEDKEFRQTRQYFDFATIVLQRSGVPKAHIQHKISVEDKLFDGIVVAALQHPYSGIIVNSGNKAIVEPLCEGELNRRTKQYPGPELWVIDTSPSAQIESRAARTH